MVDQYKKGMAFEDYVKEMILDPLELNNTGFKYTSGYAFTFMTSTIVYLNPSCIVLVLNPRWL